MKKENLFNNENKVNKRERLCHYLEKFQGEISSIKILKNIWLFLYV